MDYKEIFNLEADYRTQRYDYEAVVMAVTVADYDKNCKLSTLDCAIIGATVSAWFTEPSQIMLPKELQVRANETADFTGYALRTVQHWYKYYMEAKK